jgi:hypothetical protein
MRTAFFSQALETKTPVNDGITSFIIELLIPKEVFQRRGAPPPGPNPDGAMDFQSSQASFTMSWWSRSCSTSPSASLAAKTRAHQKAGSPSSSSSSPPPPQRSPSAAPLYLPSAPPPPSLPSGPDFLCKHGLQQDIPDCVEPKS